MTHTPKRIVIFGGSGFVGRAIATMAAQAGWLVRIATRRRNASAADLGLTGFQVGQVMAQHVDYADPASIDAAVAGCDAVVYSIGLLFEKGGNRFEDAHIHQPARVAAACAVQGVRLVHISALACDISTSEYARTKYEGEQVIRAKNPRTVILRPSLIFGAGDGFFNLFGEMMRLLPALPLIGGGRTKFQPVYVQDVARAVMAALSDTCTDGQTYDIAGPEIVTFEEMLRRLRTLTGRNTVFVPIPFWAARIKAAAMSLLPKPILTPDQVESLRTDNISDGSRAGLEALGITPVPMNTILPTYCARFAAGGIVHDVA